MTDETMGGAIYTLRITTSAKQPFMWAVYATSLAHAYCAAQRDIPELRGHELVAVAYHPRRSAIRDVAWADRAA